MTRNGGVARRNQDLVREESSSADLLIPEPNLPEHGTHLVEIPKEIGKFTPWKLVGKKIQLSF